jgi:F-type H+-transporting ATPase subunit delta
MLLKSLADRYARALFESGASVLDPTLESLGAFVQAVFSDKQLSRFFCHPEIPAADKKKVLEDVFGPSGPEGLKSFIGVIIDEGRMEYLPLIRERLTILRDQSRNLVVAEAVTSEPLAEDQKLRLQKGLEHHLDRTVQLVCRVETGIIGGIRVSLGDRVIDATLKYRLKEMRDTLGG